MTRPGEPLAVSPTRQTLPRPPRDRLLPTLRKATVVAVAAETVDLSIGGSDQVVPAGWVGARPLTGQVVSALLVFGSAVVLGPTSLDVWHTVGAAGEPIFGGTWGQITGTRKAGFRLNGDRVELCGAAGATGGATAGSTIFTLPSGYVPDLLVRFTMSANQSGGNNIAVSVVVQPIGSANPGAVQITHFAGTVTWGSVGFESLSFPLIGAV